MIFDFFSASSNKVLILVVLLIFTFFSCDQKSNEHKVNPKVISSEEKVIVFLSSILDDNNLKSKTINTQIDSIHIEGEIIAKDSINKLIYIGIEPKNKGAIYQRLEGYFNDKFGEVQCNKSFCAWKKQPSKKRITEVFLMDESKEKKFPYFVLEIEEIYER